jgi:hypothetical protein
MRPDDYYSASIVEKAIKIKYKKNRSIFTCAIVSLIKNDINVLKTLRKYNFPIPYKFINYKSRNYIIFEKSSLLFGMGIGDFICITVDKTGSVLFSDCKTNENYSIKEFMDIFDGMYFNCFIQYHQELHRWLKDTFEDCGIDCLIITKDDIKAAFVQTKKAVKNYLGKIDDDDEGPIDEYKDRIINEYKDKIKEDYGIDLDDEELEDEDNTEIPETSQINAPISSERIKDDKASNRIPLPDHDSRILVKFKRNEYDIKDNLYACGIFDFFKYNNVYSLMLYNGTIINFTSIDDFIDRVDLWVYI